MQRRFSSFCVLIVVFALGAWAQANGLPAALAGYWGDVSYLSRQHVLLAAESSAIAVAIGVPLGVALTRRSLRRVAPLVMQGAGHAARAVRAGVPHVAAGPAQHDRRPQLGAAASGRGGTRHGHDGMADAP